MWCEAGFPPETFWHQTQRSFANALAGAAKRDIAMAWKIAALTGAASIGKLPPLDEMLAPAKPAPEPSKHDGSLLDSHDAKLLHFFFKLKSKNIPMEIERLH